MAYGSATAIRVSATLVVVTVVMCMVAVRGPIYNGFFTAGSLNSANRALNVSSGDGFGEELTEPVQIPELKNYYYSADERLLDDAVRASRIAPPVSAAPKIAFLFLARKDMPLEPLWRRFFAGHEGRYSLYVHTNPNFTFPSSSLFFKKEVPSQGLEKMSKSLAEAVRRLYAMALLDWESNNVWFVNLCDKTIPLRSFNDTYEYLTGSQQSFVQAYQPSRHYTDAMPYFDAATEFRKGEVWMALNRKHTITLVADRDVWSIFLEKCLEFCYFGESYFQTLFNLKDPGGIANRTVVFVDWGLKHFTSPRMYTSTTTNASRLHEIASLTEDPICGTTFQQNVTVHCEYNNVPGAACFLFARKFHPSALNATMTWFSHIEGFETDFSPKLGADHRG